MLRLVQSSDEKVQQYWGELTGAGEVKLHLYVGDWRELIFREPPPKMRGPFLAKSRVEAFTKLETKLGVTSRRTASPSPGKRLG